MRVVGDSFAIYGGGVVDSHEAVSMKLQSAAGANPTFNHTPVNQKGTSSSSMAMFLRCGWTRTGCVLGCTSRGLSFSAFMRLL